MSERWITLLADFPNRKTIESYPISGPLYRSVCAGIGPDRQFASVPPPFHPSLYWRGKDPPEFMMFYEL